MKRLLLLVLLLLPLVAHAADKESAYDPVMRTTKPYQEAK